MSTEPFSALPTRPPHVADWEDLLLRFELGPRAVRNTLPLAAERWGTPREQAERSALPYLNRLLLAEAELSEWMEALRDGRSPAGEWGAAERGAAEQANTEFALSRFESLRSRNFAMLQRRGVNVWDWTVNHPLYGEVTAFQVVSAAVRRDGRLLAELRDALSAARSC